MLNWDYMRWKNALMLVSTYLCTWTNCYLLAEEILRPLIASWSKPLMLGVEAMDLSQPAYMDEV
jgi:hypothetical protein